MSDGDDDPVAVRQGLERFLRHLGAPPADVLTGLADRWPDIVGPGLAGATRPLELVDKVLVIGCDDPAWASQISWMEGQIRTRFADAFDGAEIDRVVVRTQR